MLWLNVDALDEHWKPDIRADVLEGRSIRVDTKNIRGFSIDFPSPFNPFKGTRYPTLNIDGQRIDLPENAGKGAIAFFGSRKKWSLVTNQNNSESLEKRPGLRDLSMMPS